MARQPALLSIVVGAVIAVGCSGDFTPAEVEAAIVAHRDQVVVEVTDGGCVVRPSGEIECSLWSTGAEGYWEEDADDGMALLDPPSGSFVSIDGMASTWRMDILCGLRDDGVVVCWVAVVDPESWESRGLDWRTIAAEWRWEPQLPSQGEFVAMAAAAAESDDLLGSVCGVTSAGGVECRSLDTQYQAEPSRHYFPFDTGGRVLADIEYEFEEPITEFAAVQSSESKWNWGDMCGIGRDGYVSCWGFQSLVPPDARFRSIALGINMGKYDDAHNTYYLMCGVSVEDDLHCWGDFGWLSHPDLSHVVIEGNFVKVKMFTAGISGSQRICALTETGEMVCWWSNEDFGDLEGLREDFDMVSSDPEVLLRRRDTGLGRKDPQAFGEGYVDLVLLERTVTERTLMCGVLPDGSTECWVYNIPGLSRIDWNPGPVRVG